MPLKSKAQLGYLMANNPKVGREFISKTPNIKSLPNHVDDSTSWGDKSRRIK